MAKIAVDIDDTLYSFRDISKDALFHLAQKKGDKEILSAAYTEALQWRTLADVAGDDVLMEAIELAHSPAVMNQQPAFRGAPETLYGLVDNGHELIYISNRDEDSADATRNWLLKNNFPDPGSTFGVELKCLWGDKIPHLTDCQYIIDDRVSTLISFVYNRGWGEDHTEEEGRKGFGIHAPHNTNLTDVKNVYLAPTWAGLNYYLVRKGLLSEPAYDPFKHLNQEALFNGNGSR
jgi:hypothetical protein